MPDAPPTFRPHPRAPDRRDKSLYGAAWRRERLVFLGANPLCRYCALEGRDTLATLIDHLYPHNNNAAVFWDRLHWVASCAPCHNGLKQSVERKGARALDDLAARLGLPARDRGSKSLRRVFV